MPKTQRKHNSVHSVVLKKAWKEMWHHKTWWVLGFFAAFLNTGGVIDALTNVLRHVKDVNSIHEHVLYNTPGLLFVTEYLGRLSESSSGRIAITSIAIVILLVGIAILSVWSQSALFMRFGSRKKKHALTSHKADSKTLWHVFVTNIFAKACLVILTNLFAAAMLVFAASNLDWHVLGRFGTFVVFIPIILIVGYLSTFGVIEIVVKKKPLHTALLDAWELLKAHWLTITEMALVLFLISLGFVVAYIVSLLVIIVIYVILFMLAVTLSPTFLVIPVMIIGSLAVVLLLAAFIGAFTTFAYASWYHLYKHLGGKLPIYSKTHRILAKHVPGLIR